MRTASSGKKSKKSHQFTPRAGQACIRELTERSQDYKQDKLTRSRSLHIGYASHCRKHQEGYNKNLIRDFLKQDYSQRSVPNKVIFMLPKRIEKIKLLNEERSQEILMNRICRECTHQQPQACELPSIQKRSNYKKKHKNKKLKKIRPKQVCVSHHLSQTLPDNSKLHGRIRHQHLHSAKQSSKKNQSMAEQSVNIVYECDQESQEGIREDGSTEGYGKNKTNQKHSSHQQGSTKLTYSNPLTTVTKYHKNKQKAFYRRYQPHSYPQSQKAPLAQLFTSMNTEQYIRKYVPKNKDVKLEEFIFSPFFQISLQTDEETISLYFGEKKYGVKNGIGIYIENHLIKEGRWVKDELMDGFLENDEYCYFGTFYQGGRHGYGKCIWKSGGVYVGDWQLDEMHGNGVWTDQSSKLKYLGDWKFSRPQGMGVISKKSVGEYEGEILNWKPHGKGKQIFQNSDVYEGEFFKGLPEGKGKYTWRNKSKFTGYFDKGDRMGIGKFEAPGTLKFEGQYLNDLPNGEGRVVYVNSDEYKGEMRAGLREGQGTLTCKNKKKIYQGNWLNDQLKPPLNPHLE